MSPETIKDEYDFPDLRNAEVLHQRAKGESLNVSRVCFSILAIEQLHVRADMIERGFEWTLQQGQPQNVASRRYRWHQPCCSLAVDDRMLRCGHAWNVTPEFPRGDPLYGAPWTKAYPDPGTYDGGELYAA